MEKKNIISDVANYYTEKLQTFGATPKGVDWNSTESQELRFHQLLRLLEGNSNSFSCLDYGCGFGSMYDFLKKECGDLSFFYGYDIASDMLDKAIELHGDGESCEWVNSINNLPPIDYVFSSGIFNVRMGYNDAQWQAYILETLQEMDRLSTKGFAFNMLTSYSDKEYMRDYLYYADSLFFFDYCKKHFSKKVALLHDYPLFEFTMLIKK